MNERTFRPANIAAAAVMIGGLLSLLLPQHGATILRLVIVTIAAAAGVYALAVRAPPAWWKSPFDQVSNRRRREERDEIDWIRSKLVGPRQRITRGRAVPPETLRLLQPLIESALEREGFDPADRTSIESARNLLSPLTAAVLASEPLKRGFQFRMVRPDAAATAVFVHAVLDDLERLSDGTRSPHLS
jgi:hypothetical protein